MRTLQAMQQLSELNDDQFYLKRIKIWCFFRTFTLTLWRRNVGRSIRFFVVVLSINAFKLKPNKCVYNFPTLVRHRLNVFRSIEMIT